MIDKACECGFFFIRHGQTVANRGGVRSGAESDTHLTELIRYGPFQQEGPSHRKARYRRSAPATIRVKTAITIIRPGRGSFFRRGRAARHSSRTR